MGGGGGGFQYIQMGLYITIKAREVHTSQIYPVVSVFLHRVDSAGAYYGHLDYQS